MKKAFAVFLALCMVMTLFSAAAESSVSSLVSRLKERVSDAVSEAPAALSSLSGKVQQAIGPAEEKIGSLLTGLKSRTEDGSAPNANDGAADENADSALPSGDDRAQQSRQGPRQYTVDFWDGLFGTWGDGISLADDPVNDGLVIFVMELPDPVSMPETYSVSYKRLDKGDQEVITMLERDSAGNIHYIDGDNEHVFVRTGGRYRGYTISDGGFVPWNETSLSARTVRQQTAPFWNCADQTFIKWLGMDVTGETEYLGRAGSLCSSESGTITFTYLADMIIDDETGVCLFYSADELLRGATFSVTEDNKIQIDIGQYDIGGDEMNFNCIRFETENVSFALPAEHVSLIP